MAARLLRLQTLRVGQLHHFVRLHLHTCRGMNAKDGWHMGYREEKMEEKMEEEYLIN